MVSGYTLFPQKRKQETIRKIQKDFFGKKKRWIFTGATMGVFPKMRGHFQFPKPRLGKAMSQET